MSADGAALPGQMGLPSTNTPDVPTRDKRKRKLPSPRASFLRVLVERAREALRAAEQFDAIESSVESVRFVVQARAAAMARQLT